VDSARFCFLGELVDTRSPYVEHEELETLVTAYQLSQLLGVSHHHGIVKRRKPDFKLILGSKVTNLFRVPVNIIETNKTKEI
jgi:hypothetical protein